MNNKTITIVLTISIITALIGFYITFDKIASLSTAVSNLELAQQIKSKDAGVSATTNTAPTQATADPSSVATPIPASQATLVVKIPTAVIFETNSSPTLTPQASTTLTIENVSKLSDGSLVVDIKAFTSKATSYTAIDPKTLIVLVDVNGNNESAITQNGSFQSMPPKSSVSGQLIFKPSETRDSYVIQIGTGDDTKFYEFDFVKKSYKETVIG